jgi:DNA-3-methyladenine glycosylase
MLVLGKCSQLIMIGMSELTTILSIPAEEAAPRLLGCYMEREINGHRLVGKIVETEAYDQSDAASHSYKGQTPRTTIMFGPPGHLYVYFTYGMHYCCNVVAGPKGHGSAVLIRAMEPIEGQDLMAENRGGRGGHDATNGPAKLCQAFQINKEWNGHDLHKPPLKLIIKQPVPQDKIIQTTRIGISEAKEQPWRFYIKNNPFVSIFS